jgi:hypothetical protein
LSGEKTRSLVIKVKRLSLGVEKEEQIRIGNMLYCQVGSLLMKYLGIPISDTSVGIHAFDGMVEKMNKLQYWKGKKICLLEADIS